MGGNKSLLSPFISLHPNTSFLWRLSFSAPPVLLFFTFYLFFYISFSLLYLRFRFDHDVLIHPLLLSASYFMSFDSFLLFFTTIKTFDTRVRSCREGRKFSFSSFLPHLRLNFSWYHFLVLQSLTTCIITAIGVLKKISNWDSCVSHRNTSITVYLDILSL